MRYLNVSALILALAAPSASGGFEPATHALVTLNAYQGFAQEHPTTLSKFGAINFLSARVAALERR